MPNAIKPAQVGADPIASDVRQMQMMFNALADMGLLQLAGMQATPAAPTGADSGTSGNLNGSYIWKTVVITGWKQDDGSYYVSGFASSAASASATVTNHSASLTSIATGTGPTIGRAIYRTAAGGAAGTEKYVGVIWDNTTTTFTDNVSDANLGTGMPTSASSPAVYGSAIPGNVPTANSTGTSLAESTLLGYREMLPNYDQYVSSPDAGDIYTVLQLKRPDGTLYMQSTLSNPDSNGNYQTDTWQFYDAAGTTVVRTHVWNLTYDSSYKITQKVRTS